MEKNVALMNLVIKVVQFIYYSCIAIISIGPLINYYFNNEKTLILDLYIPLVDHTTTHGYLITSLMHTLLLPYGSIGLIICDLTFFVTCYQIRTMVGFLEVDLMDTKKIVQQSDFKFQKDCRKARKIIKEIIATHQNILR